MYVNVSKSHLQIIVALRSDITAIKAAFAQAQATMDLLLVFDVVDNHRFGDMNERVVEYGRTSSFTEERDLSSSATIDNV